MTTGAPARVTRPLRQAAPPLARRRPRASVRLPNDRLDASLVLLVPAICTNVWYWQLIIPGLAPLRPSIVTVLVALVAYLASPVPLRLAGDPLRKPVRLMLAIGIVAIIGGPFAILRGAALNFVIYDYTPSIILALLVAARVRSEYSLRFMIDAVLWSGTVYAVNFLQAPLDIYGKPFGTPYYDANDGAIMGLVCAVLAAGRLASARSMLARLPFALLAVLYFAMVVYSSSRGAFLSLCVTVLALLFFARAVPFRWRLGSILGGIVLITALGSSSYWNLMKTLLEPENDYNWSGNSETGRIELWKRGFGYMLEDPLLGAGAKNYSNKEGRSKWAKQAELEGRGVKWSVSHNAYVAVGVELGFPGLIVFAIMLWTAARNLRRAAVARATIPSLRGLLEFLLIAIYGFCFASLFISSQYWTFLYLLVVLASAGAVIARDGARRPSAAPSSTPLPAP